MSRYQFTLQGLSPGLLMNPATDQLLEQLRTKTPARKRTDISIEADAGTKLYVDGDGNSGIPSLMLYASLVSAGQLVKTGVGTTKVSTASSTMLYGMMELEEEFFSFPDGTEWKADMRRGTNPKDGVMVAIVRPLFREWSITGHVRIFDEEVNSERIREVFEKAGKFRGLGDFRPGKKGPFGRSEVAAWVELEAPKRAAAPAAKGRKTAKGNGKADEVGALADITA